MDSTLDDTLAAALLKSYGSFTLEQQSCVSTLFRSHREGNLCAKGFDSRLLDSFSKELIGDSSLSQTPLVRDKDRLYLQKNFVYETEILRHLKRLKMSTPEDLFDPVLFEELLAKEEKLFPEQAASLKKAFHSPFFLLCGGPGTGKTYTAALFIRLLLASLKEGERLHLCLAALTGKAASHLRNVLLSQGALDPRLCLEATTLHRCLKLKPGESHLFSKRRIDADIVFIDEASMIGAPLFAELLEAVGSGTRLFMMGDPDQLPPIDSASLFADLAEIHGTRLHRCIRTDESTLRDLAEAIQRGEEIGDKLQSLKKVDGALDEALPQLLFQKIQPLFSSKKPDPTLALAHYSRFRVLNALRQGPFGTEILNQKILELLKAKMGPCDWWALPLLIEANDPRLGLYNGMTGVLIGQKGQKGVAYFSDKPQEEIHTLPPFQIAFTLSIHKSQGSEFEEVLALFPSGSENFGRECLYTALTRAKKKFEWIGEEKILREMVTHFSRRTSGFLDRANDFI